MCWGQEVAQWWGTHCTSIETWVCALSTHYSVSLWLYHRGMLQVGTGGSLRLGSQTRQNGKLQVQWETLSQNIGWEFSEEDTAHWPLISLHTRIQTVCLHLNAHVHTLTCTCTCNIYVHTHIAHSNNQNKNAVEGSNPNCLGFNCLGFWSCLSFALSTREIS